MFELPSSLKDHPIITLGAGFMLGIAAFQGVLEIGQLEIEPEQSKCTKTGQAALWIETNPSDAEVLIKDSNDSSREYWDGICLEIDRYQLIISKKGYETARRTVALNRTDRIELIKLQNSINIDLAGSEQKVYPEDMQKINFDFYEIEVRKILKLLADISGMNMAIPEGLDRLISIKLQNVPWELAFDTVLQLNGLEAESKGNIIVITEKYKL